MNTVEIPDLEGAHPEFFRHGFRNLLILDVIITIFWAFLTLLIPEGWWLGVTNFIFAMVVLISFWPLYKLLSAILGFWMAIFLITPLYLVFLGILHPFFESLIAMVINLTGGTV